MTVKPNKEYWIDRAMAYEQQAYDDTSTRIAKINQGYIIAQRYLSAEVRKIYDRYFKDDMTEQEVQDILDTSVSASELVSIKALASTIEDKEATAAINRYLNQLAAKSRITRLEELKAKAYISAKYAGATELKQNEELYTKIAKDTWKQATAESAVFQSEREFELKKGDELTTNSKKEIVIKDKDGKQVTKVSADTDQAPDRVTEIPADYTKQVASRKWDGANYSERIWKNTDKLAQRLAELFNAHEMSGMTETAMARALATEFQTSMFNAKRLIRTESNYIANAVKIDRWKARGVKQYQFEAVLDQRTSKICRATNGKIFNVADAQPGVNLPPMHPFCRSIAIIHL
ncbi:prophage head protein [Lactobacillus nasalidis]|uniref:Prophage head protein n=1 Tax=Lactobacillus nasalidis TaxID=2797258 RepID=A0ABQ3WB95_9LACO|nr:minor capsid protein [Lactobacillus nasalidis]GHV97888.1 prophage head protein [Lactobacillus nasalidis]GHW00118.1 prophage head protein [Lactobacillus nasalidis]GHW01477.1 prophage head protein [Lactobacillus nasalidis]